MSGVRCSGCGYADCPSKSPNCDFDGERGYITRLTEAEEGLARGALYFPARQRVYSAVAVEHILSDRIQRALALAVARQAAGCHHRHQRGETDECNACLAADFAAALNGAQ